MSGLTSRLIPGFVVVLLVVVTASAPAAPWRFAVVGDTHVTATSSTIPAEIVTALLGDDIRFVLVAGDLVESGRGASLSRFRQQLQTWQETFAPLYAAGIGVYPVRGNHEDDVPDGLETWRSMFSGDYAPPLDGPAGEEGLTYSLTVNNARIIALDDYVDIHRVNQAWLDARLATDPAHPHVFVFGHEAAFQVNHADCLGTYPADRDVFWSHLAAAGVRVYFAGHDHFCDLARIGVADGRPDNDLIQAVVGTGGGDLFPRYGYNGDNGAYEPVLLAHRAEYGYLLVEISGTGPADRAVSLTWKSRVVDGSGTVTYRAANEPIRYTLPGSASPGAYPVVDTGITTCYDATGEIPPPAAGQPFYGQDGQQEGHAPSCTDNGDGTVTDNVTGLMWIKARGSKLSWSNALAGASACTTGGYTDWRLPTIKELYSLIRFTGAQGSSMIDPTGYIPFIDTDCFDFVYGAGTADERIIDCQDWSATAYVSTTMTGTETVFGVNFADGRIKGYPRYVHGGDGLVDNRLYVRYVRGNPAYGLNRFVDNGDETVTDTATGLMWSRIDSGQGLDWEAALAWVQARNTEHFLGHSDWRLPNAKELQSIVDYARSPDTTGSASIDPVFDCTTIINEGGQPDYPYFWTGTSFRDGSPDSVSGAYIAFGRALGWMVLQSEPGVYQLLDVHGAGAQRSDPKSGDPARYPYGRGPQGDVVRITNFVRLVRDAPPGDLDGDGRVSAVDAVLLRQYLAENLTLSTAARTAADLDGDGTTSLRDLMELLLRL